MHEKQQLFISGAFVIVRAPYFAVVKMSSDSNPEVQSQNAALGTELHDSALNTQGAQAILTQEQLQVQFSHMQRTCLTPHSTLDTKN
jgi:hypothetical protein